ncbi:MAG: ABC transporter substrate-binding protein [Oscillospiraceae bacterium]|jgi:spermidine/putrescine transport system substrate-binding protein|nr:ABC transporter substrate-binding protein [Oscillospiraceae bacterium]
MKKPIIILTALCLLLAGCADGAMRRLADAGYDFGYTVENNTGSTVVNVYNWGEYMDEDLNKAFESVTGIKVNYDTFQTNEMLYSTLKSGGSSYDVVIPSDYMIGRLIEEDMLLPLDFGNIPNFENVDPKFKNPEYDPQNLFSAPYMWGTVGIIYDTTRVASPIESWGALFDERYGGEILMFDNSRDAIGIALKLLGYSYNTINEAELREAYDLLAEQKPLVQAYVMDQIFDKMENGEAILAPYYAGDAIMMMESNEDLAFVIPSEGSNIFTDAFVIPKGAANKAAAEMYIDFMCSYNAGSANVAAVGYSTPLLDVYAGLDASVKNDGVSYPQDFTLLEAYANMPRETRDLYDRLWTDLLR